MSVIDFQEVLDGMVTSDKQDDPIQSIYKIIPVLDSVQLKIVTQTYYFIKKWHLDDLEKLFDFIFSLMDKNKSLGFFSSKVLKDFLAAHTQNELIRGVSVRSNPVNVNSNEGLM